MGFWHNREKVGALRCEGWPASSTKSIATEEQDSYPGTTKDQLLGCQSNATARKVRETKADSSVFAEQVP